MAAKKRVKFEGIPEDDSDDDAAAAPVTKKARRFKDKHSLDSDEEDNADDVGDQLGEEDLAHQEEATIDWDGDTRVTPFNLKEEMEEGRFDAHGNYYPGKGEENVADEWLDSVDWERIRETEGSEPQKEHEDSSDEEGVSPSEKQSLLRKVIELLQPGETVASALRRLGGGSRGVSRRQSGKTKRTVDTSSESNAELGKNKQLLLELTEAADKLLHAGRMTIYSDTHEKLRFELFGELAPVAVSSSAEARFVEDTSSASGMADSAAESAAAQSSTVASVDPESSEEVCWVYKWADSDDADVHGPFTSTQMNDWTEAGFFPDGVFVRKAKDKDGPFYSSKRIDFDLYID